jgi:endonuclease/exonuclease/phosphatase family metal-dependent hydrolase
MAFFVVLALGLLAWAALPRPLASQRGGPVALPSGASRPAEQSLLRVATYNIHGAKGLDGKRDLGRVGDVIRDAEVLALQEVHEGWCRKNQARVLAKRHGLACLYAPTRQRWFRAHRGNALLSRFRITAWRREPLPHHGGGRRFRNFTVATVDFGGRALSILFTHLHTRAGREQQLQQVLDHFRTLSPAVLLGDLNTTPGDPLLTAFLAAGQADDALRGIASAPGAAERVDWILCRGLAVRASGSSPAGPSDHPYYWADVEIQEPRQ